MEADMRMHWGFIRQIGQMAVCTLWLTAGLLVLMLWVAVAISPEIERRDGAADAGIPLDSRASRVPLGRVSVAPTRRWSAANTWISIGCREVRFGVSLRNEFASSEDGSEC
jgi:hypothetical protein